MSNETFQIEIDSDHVLKLLHSLTPAAMQNAWRRTLRKTSVWIKGQTARETSRETRIPLGVIRKRLAILKLNKDAYETRLDLRPLAAHKMGKPRQDDVGVTAGNFRFPGAFIMKNRAKSPVFRRVGRKRLPIRMETVDFAAEGGAALRATAAKCEERLLVILKQEVTYELQKALGNAR
jgi:hypothetical protein